MKPSRRVCPDGKLKLVCRMSTQNNRYYAAIDIK